MLMTFPTKESLIRNLNERDVSEVFLIIANFKGALKNQVQHPDRVGCCDGKTVRTIEA